MPKTSPITSAIVITASVSFLAYVVYFDYKRRHDQEFRQALRKNAKKFANKDLAAKSKERKQLVLDLKARYDEFMLTAPALPLSATAAERQQFFLAHVSVAGELLEQMGKEIDAALYFFRALCVYPQPFELLKVFKENLSHYPNVYDMVVMLIAIQPLESENENEKEKEKEKVEEIGEEEEEVKEDKITDKAIEEVKEEKVESEEIVEKNNEKEEPATESEKPKDIEESGESEEPVVHSETTVSPIAPVSQESSDNSKDVGGEENIEEKEETIQIPVKTEVSPPIEVEAQASKEKSAVETPVVAIPDSTLDASSASSNIEKEPVRQSEISPEEPKKTAADELI